jgi:hypothetical protein
MHWLQERIAREPYELGASPADDQTVALEATGDEAKTEAQF